MRSCQQKHRTFKGALFDFPYLHDRYSVQYTPSLSRHQDAGFRVRLGPGGAKTQSTKCGIPPCSVRLPAVDPGLSKCGPDPKKQEAVDFCRVRHM